MTREKGSRSQEGRGGRERKKLRLQLQDCPSCVCEGYLYSV